MMLSAISLWQPWASLCFPPGPKIHETRGWRPPARLIGRRIAIHAAKKRVRIEDPELERLCRERLTQPLPYGAIIGTALLAEVYLSDLVRIRQADPLDVLCGDWTPGARWLWRLEDPQPIEPRPETGRQGWWQVDLPEAA